MDQAKLVDRVKVDQIIGEAFVKAAQIVLTSRVYESSRIFTKPGAQAWFNLEVEELESAKAEVDTWRRDYSCPLVIGIYLQPWGTAARRHTSAASTSSPQAASHNNNNVETLLEQWVISYPMAANDGRRSPQQSLLRFEPPAIYKRVVVMLRSLYSYVRVLPAYRMYRACKRQNGANFSIRYTMSRGQPGGVGAERPVGSARMQLFNFSPVDTPYGSLSLSVHYQPSATVAILEQTTSPPPLPQIIADYIGGGQGGLQGYKGFRTMSTSLYERMPTLPDPSSSPPVTSGAGILRNVQKVATFSRRAAGWGGQAVRGSPGRYHTPPSATPDQGIPLTPISPKPVDQSQRTANPFANQSLSTPPKYPTTTGGLASSPGSRSKPPTPKQPGPSPFSNQGLRGYQMRSTSLPPNPTQPIFRDPSSNLGTLPSKENVPEPEPPSPPTTSRAQQSDPASQRKSSAPVCIPGRGSNRHHSSNDLWSLGQAKATGASPHKGDAPAVKKPAPSSAPAAPCHVPSKWVGLAGNHMTTGQPAAGVHVSHPPATPPPSHPPTLVRQSPSYGDADRDMATSFASSCYPASCSPQLPFAFTPSAQSLASFTENHGLASWSAMIQPSPPVSSRDMQALAAIRKQGWSARSSSTEGAMPITLSPGGHDSFGSSILSSSTPRHLSGLTYLTSPTTSPGMTTTNNTVTNRVSPALRSHPLQQQQCGLPCGDESESECLPFALDADGPSSADAAKGMQPVETFGSVSSGLQAEADAAVCAFVRLVQEAPPLLSSPIPDDNDPSPAPSILTVSEALAKISNIREKLQGSQVVM